MSGRYYLTDSDVNQLRHINRTVTELVDAPPNVNRRRAIAAGEPLWTPEIRKNYRVDYWGTIPWVIIFRNARRIFHGVMQYDDLEIWLPAAAVSAGSVYIYAADINTNTIPVLRWTASPLWDNTVGLQTPYIPIRYVGKVTFGEDTLQLDDIPQETVVFPGGPADSVRLIASWAAAWQTDLSSTLEPAIYISGSAISSDLVTGRFSSGQPETHFDLSTYASLGSSMMITAGGSAIKTITNGSVIGDVSSARPIAQLGEVDAFGFRPIVWQDPAYAAKISSRGYAWNADTLILTQYYIGAGGEMSTVTKEISASTISGWSASAIVYLDIDYVTEQGALSAVRMRLSTETNTNPGSGITRISYIIGKVTPASVGIAKTQMYFDLITLQPRIY